MGDKPLPPKFLQAQAAPFDAQQQGDHHRRVAQQGASYYAGGVISEAAFEARNDALRRRLAVPQERGAGGQGA